MAGNVMPAPKAQFFDTAGNPLSGGKVYFYVAGGYVTPQDTFSDSALASTNTNPVILDSNGEATIFLLPLAYNVMLKTATDVERWSQPNVTGIALSTALTSVTTRVTTLEAVPVRHGVCEGRITLTAATPVTTADVTAATAVKFSPYHGSRIGLYDGASAWVIRSFAELSLSLGTDTASLPYDLFAYDNAGVAALERLAWTNTTTRATALVLQDGVLVKTGATTRRYLGTYCTTSTIGQTEDSDTKRLVWNYYNRVSKRLRVADATASWAYTTATYRQARATATNQVELVIGYLESLLDLTAYHHAANDNAAVALATSIGEDSTSAGTATTMGQAGYSTVINIRLSMFATLRKFPAVGYHYYAWLEKSAATGTTTWYGTSADQVSGLLGSVEC